MQPADKEYQEHGVFSDIPVYASFYNDLSQAVFRFLTVGTGAFCNIDSYLLSSVAGTLASIASTLREGRISDSYSLLRKYYDSCVINIYTALYLDEQFRTTLFIVKRIDDWVKGTTRLPEYRVMSQYIRESARAAPVTSVIQADDRYRAIRNRCNDHTHYNFYHNVLLNDADIVISHRRRVLDQLRADVRDIFVFHMAYLLFLKEHYMASSDYVDYLDSGLQPEEDSQYWVAPFVQDVFDQVLSGHRPDIAALIKQTSSMHLR